MFVRCGMENQLRVKMINYIGKPVKITHICNHRMDWQGREIPFELDQCFKDCIFPVT